MTLPLVTKSGFCLLSPQALIDCVTMIEKGYPGWWWSLSQRRDLIFVNMGPGRNCPLKADVAWAMTREGDTGSSYSHDVKPGVVDEADLIENIDTFTISFNSVDRLEEIRANGGRIIETLPLAYRKQSEADLTILKRIYENFLADVKSVEARGHQIEEIYIGSCDSSADCSIRGKRVDDSEFDISFDLTGEGTIAEALSWAAGELKNDVLTPR
jgi:hypothetical protein